MSSDKKKPISLDWSAFQALGNPMNAAEESEVKAEKMLSSIAKMVIRVHYERKGRGGKEAVIIRDHTGTVEEMEELCKLIKTKILKVIVDAGYKKAIKAGA
jgi:hypothetical protein